MWYFSYFLMTLLGLSGIFLIGLILLQRGRGGGLAGAFGGMGGQSAFGTKAGDVFTRITIGIASAWILLCAGSVLALHYTKGPADEKIFKQADEGDKPKKAQSKGKDDGGDIELPPPADDNSANSQSKDAQDKGGVLTDKTGDSKKSDATTKEKPSDDKKSDDEKKSDEQPKDDVKPKDGDKSSTEVKPDNQKDGDKKASDSKPESNPEPKSE